MVFKSEKNLMEPLKKNSKSPGPGEYIPQTKYKKIHLTKEPFCSTINGTFRKRNNFPGPGAYYQDDILINFLQNIQNEKITENNDKKSLSQSKKNDTKTIHVDNKINNSEKLGFNSKTKRFSNISISSNKPGPGYYFPKINKFYKNKLIKKKEEEFNSKQRQKDKLSKEFKLVPTIPSKSQKFGFDILEDGKIIIKKDPNFNNTFTGEKDDTVGPGTYEVEKKNELYKTRPQWTMSKDVRNCYITNWENLSKLETPSLISTNHSDNSNNFNNSNLLSSITANKFFIDDNLKVIEFSPYNISNYSNSNYDSQTIFNNSNNYSFNIVNKNVNNNKIITNNLYYKEKFGKIHSNQIFNTNNIPGPGFYIDRFKHSSFKYKYVPENKQFFGPNLERFQNINKSYNNCNIDSDLDLIEDKKIKSKSKSFIISTPFSNTEQRFKIPYNMKEKYANPGPSDYGSIKYRKIRSFSNFDKFNTSSKRFIEDNTLKWKNELPGPGHYNPEKAKKHISTKNISFSINDKNINTNTNSYINSINYKINTIEYLNYKKLKSTNLKNVTFFRSNPGMTKSLSFENISGPSPGSYYHEKKYEYKQIIPAFNKSSEKISDFNKKSDINVGPGQYNRDSYFDWHRKTFNISYV